VRIKWYGHSAFRLTTADGVTVVVDPYESGAFGDSLSYTAIEDSADVVLVSHNHADHNYTNGIKGPYSDMRKEGTLEIKGMKVAAIPTFHDASGGVERGQNLMFVIDSPADRLRVVHMGDLGHPLEGEALRRIGRVDVMMIPVGGFFTIDALAATEVMKALNPPVTIPMHFKTDKVQFPITGVEEFTKGKENVRIMDTSEVDITSEKLPKEPEILVLRYAN
jgi:L-ascorbate metabolism protein UlaG (beta-lactamase superfamily)